MKFPYCGQCRHVVINYAIAVNGSLVLFKGGLGLMTGSTALVADAFHSGADVIAAIMTTISVRISNAPADADHAYGHGKVQFLSAFLIGLILTSGASALLWSSVSAVISGDYTAPSRIAVFGAIISIIANEIMFRDQRCVATELNSPAIMANAWDNRSDAISSIGVLIGLIFATFGFPIADPLASVVLALIVFHIGFELIVDAIQGLMDTMPDRERLEKIYRIAKQSPGVLGVAYLRARIMGEALHVVLNVQVDGRLKVYEGDLIVDVLKDKIARGMEDSQSEIQIYLTPVAVKAA
ncbi:MAG: magnetosome biogenesis CDF transporter MamB [Magnetococcales bacterium]|nr:magnetosome biogenesis CDF transporter MamB [Magnetococcales bacterium]